MLSHNKDDIQKHIKTHTERSEDDRNAVNVLQQFLRSDGRINANFSFNDKWPNQDGTFEFVQNPQFSRRPKQAFYVQIKGTKNYIVSGNVVKYQLQSLAFPAYICDEVTLDPGILFVVLNPNKRGCERVFWKYMSISFLNTVKFSQSSMTINFRPEDELLNTDESVNKFCEKLNQIVDHHSFVNLLNTRDYKRNDVIKIIDTNNKYIEEIIEKLKTTDETRDEISRRLLNQIGQLCQSAMLLNAIHQGVSQPSIRIAYEIAMLNVDTRYLGIFFKGLNYIGHRIPEDGQSERIMLKYYDFLWEIRETLKNKYNINILKNLNVFPIYQDDENDSEYYKKVAASIFNVADSKDEFHQLRYYIKKKTPFFINNKRYYEMTLQLSGKYATKFNRLTVYTKYNIPTNYTIQIAYKELKIYLWDMEMYIKYVTNWRVSLNPMCINLFSKILNIDTKITSRHNEYKKLMNFLTKSGINFVDLIDLKELNFDRIIEDIYCDISNSNFKDVLYYLRNNYAKNSSSKGYNTIRYVLYDLREETLTNVLPTKYNVKKLYPELNISTRCLPFETNPFLSNLPGTKTNVNSLLSRIISTSNIDNYDIVKPYVLIRSEIEKTGQIFLKIPNQFNYDCIRNYNNQLNNWEIRNGYKIDVLDNKYLYINSYVDGTMDIIRNLIEFSKVGNIGQKEFNKSFLKNIDERIDDHLKELAIENAFVESRLLMIYGAAGTGKTKLINYISNLMKDYKKLFLTKTHTALENLQRRIDNPGSNSSFVSIDSFSKKISMDSFDIIFIDECSTIDNLTMRAFLNKTSPDTFLVLAGDINQIESIEFGNWFYYVKNIINVPGSNIELVSTWRTKEQELKELWEEVRNKKPLIIEKLAIDGPFSEDIGTNVFERLMDDEVVLCLNYDGKFGLNNMNLYFQAHNKTSKSFVWDEWTYKIGDPILFNDSKNFPILYNNLKGKIYYIEKNANSITFTIDVDTILTERDCKMNKIDLIKIESGKTRIRFTIYSHKTNEEETDDERMKSVIPFQLAYAVSIHKAQGLEYDSVKVVIPNSNSEKITHGIFYTAITRAKKKLKIYWSAETMKKIIDGFKTDNDIQESLKIIKRLL